MIKTKNGKYEYCAHSEETLQEIANYLNVNSIPKEDILFIGKGDDDETYPWHVLVIDHILDNNFWDD